MKIKKIESKLIILVRSEEIPILDLLHPQGAKEFKEYFNFSGFERIQVGESRPAIRLVLGISSVDQRKIKIISLLVEDRKIIILVEGKSENTDIIWGQLQKYFASIAHVEDDTYLNPQIIARESVVITKLNIAIENLVNPNYLKFVNEDVAAAATTDIAEAWSQLEKLTFLVSYKQLGKTLEESQLTMNRKEFSISPRSGYPLSENIFYSIGPFDTDTHIKLLESFEKTVTINN